MSGSVDQSSVGYWPTFSYGNCYCEASHEGSGGDIRWRQGEAEVTYYCHIDCLLVVSQWHNRIRLEACAHFDAMVGVVIMR